MYLKKEDNNYFMAIYTSLDDDKRWIFVSQFLKAESEKANLNASKIMVIDDGFYDSHPIEPSKIITRTMIKKAYMALKERN